MPLPRSFRLFAVATILIGVAIAFVFVTGSANKSPGVIAPQNFSSTNEGFWLPPDSTQIPRNEEGNLIRYGRDLIANTSVYFGPKGTVAQISNGMNCQNCHLEAGTKAFGNNYSGVYSTYPKFRERSGAIENIYKRVNDCIERSLNGNTIDTMSREMQAMHSYIAWLGKNVEKGVRPKGVGLRDITLLDRAADPAKGKLIYTATCQRCHGENGEGALNGGQSGYVYPPLWGDHSYTTAAGLFRLSRFAGYVKDNMPFGISHKNAQLSDEEAWDIAAFVNSQPRTIKKFIKDYPDISSKPFDYPFGPYADTFSEKQHKYGPFGPIKEEQKKMATANKNKG
jgi:thiosulfate dehydrogenase